MFLSFNEKSNRVISSSGRVVFDCENLSCSDNVIKTVVSTFNSATKDGCTLPAAVVDEYLNIEVGCNDKDRDYIILELFGFM
jgi:hypothetical protein